MARLLSVPGKRATANFEKVGRGYQRQKPSSGRS